MITAIVALYVFVTLAWWLFQGFRFAVAALVRVIVLAVLVGVSRRTPDEAIEALDAWALRMGGDMTKVIGFVVPAAALAVLLTYIGIKVFTGLELVDK